VIGERHTAREPGLELPLRSYSIRRGAKPTIHFSASHRHPLHMRSPHEAFGLRRLDSDHNATLTTCPDRQIAVYQESKTAEHLLFGEPALSTQQRGKPVRVVHIKRHGRS
jgi:hypothetical protein